MRCAYPECGHCKVVDTCSQTADDDPRDDELVASGHPFEDDHDYDPGFMGSPFDRFYDRGCGDYDPDKDYMDDLDDYLREGLDRDLMEDYAQQLRIDLYLCEELLPSELDRRSYTKYGRHCLQS